MAAEEPLDAAGLSNLGLALERQGRLDEALDAHRRAVAARPDQPVLLVNLAAALLAQGGPEAAGEAEAACRRAVALDAEDAAAHHNLGLALQQAGRLAEAVASLRRAVELRPAAAGFWCNLGIALHQGGRPDEAAAAYRRAIALNPASPTAHFNLGLSLLSLGRLTEGWAEYEWRFDCPGRARRHTGPPAWRGEPGAGRSILLWVEQGMGDAIQFVRYVPLVAAAGWRVVLEAPAPLVRLFASVAGIQVVPRGQPLPPVDAQCPLLSLPCVFGTTLATIPAAIPYLRPDPAAVEGWRRRLDGHWLGGLGGPTVGLAWRGNPANARDGGRSLPAALLAPLLEGAGLDGTGLEGRGLRAVSLHPDGRPEELAALAAAGPLFDAGPALADFAETAALVAALDLVVSVDTAVAHLAGALGRPAWVLVDRAPDWRWLGEGGASPWYPSLRLFRQGASEGWPAVVARLRAALPDLL